MYFVVRWIARIVVNSFFREITILNDERIPIYGPVIFVGNHNNQFVDASMLLAMLPRHVRFLIAEKSLKRQIIGRLALQTGCISVARSQDKLYRGLGTIKWQEGSTRIEGVGTRFLLDVHIGDRIRIYNDSLEFTIKKISSDFELDVASPLPAMKLEASPTSQAASHLLEAPMNDPSSSCMTQSTIDSSPASQPTNDVASMPLSSPFLSFTSLPFEVLPRVDQSDVYEAVSDALVSGHSIAIFPEGGSHDRTELLPLKPGVAIMALRAAMEGAEDILVVPLGLNYYQAHKILSRATIQVGTPIVIRDELVQLYQKDRREAVAELLSEIEQNLKNCIVSATEYKMLKVIRLCITLYAPESMYLHSDRYHILYHQFSVLFNKFQNDSRILEFMKDFQDYYTLLKGYGIADHEVRLLRQTAEGAIFSFFELLVIFLLSVLIGLSLAPLWGPIRILSSHLAEQHRRKALAESKVKITGRDVVASYKIMTLMVLVPTANFVYSLIFGMFYCSTWFGVICCILIGLIGMPFLYYYSIRYFAKILPLLRKFRFIFLVLVSKLNAWRDTEREIITRRMQIQLQVRSLVKDLGPSIRGGFMTEMERCVPEVVLRADSKRIRRRLEKGEFVPFTSRTLLESREEIL